MKPLIPALFLWKVAVWRAPAAWRFPDKRVLSVTFFALFGSHDDLPA